MNHWLAKRKNKSKLITLYLEMEFSDRSRIVVEVLKLPTYNQNKFLFSTTATPYATWHNNHPLPLPAITKTVIGVWRGSNHLESHWLQSSANMFSVTYSNGANLFYLIEFSSPTKIVSKYI